jgi:hypothetical protein
VRFVRGSQQIDCSVNVGIRERHRFRHECPNHNDLAVLTKRIDGWFPEQIGRFGPAGYHALREHDDPRGRGDGQGLYVLRGKVLAQGADRSVADGPKVSIHRLPARWRLPVAGMQNVGDEGHGGETEETTFR